MATVFDVLHAVAKYDGSPTAHKDVVSCLKKHGHNVSMSDQWCTETIMAALYDADAIKTIGGCKLSAGDVKKQAEKNGIWHKGQAGILPGNIIIYGRNGIPNHTEIAIGNNITVAGNHKEITPDTCDRRKWKGRSVVGYVRPKYDRMPAMNNLQIAVCAVDCILGVYGSGDTRKKQLSVFGSDNAQKIQAEVNRIFADEALTVSAMAQYVLAGHAGKDSYRKTRLGKYYDKVQAEVNRILQPEKPVESSTRFRIHVEHFCRKDESAYGACTAIFQYAKDGSIAHCVLIDTAMDRTASVVVEDLKSQGVKKIDALFISHAHGDHYGGLTKILRSFPVGMLYLPDPAELDKHQRSYGDSLRRQSRKVTAFRWYKQGDSAAFGDIRFRCLYAPKAKDLSEHDSHHYVNNMSPFNVFECGSFIWHTAGDAQNPANNLFVSAMKKAGVDTKCHGMEFHWHTDGNATNEALMEATRPRICVSNYHHAGWHSGRKGPKEKAEAVGAVCYATADDGHIEIDIDGRKVTVTTTKSGKHDTYTI